MTLKKPYPDIIINQMQQDDLQQVMAIEKEAFPAPWHISFFKRALSKRKTHTHLYVARLNDKVIGYIVYYIFSGEGHIMNIAVAPKYRRRGVAKHLITSALEHAQKHAADEVFLEVAVNNTPALKLYQRFGFEIIDTRKKYYSNGDDAYVLLHTVRVCEEKR